MASPVNACEECCTPGYWKNHPGYWHCYSFDDSFECIFGVDVTLQAGGKETIDYPVLMQALNANGGDINALARHAVAALLNASDPDIDYPVSEAQIIAAVQDVLILGEACPGRVLLSLHKLSPPALI